MIKKIALTLLLFGNSINTLHAIQAASLLKKCIKNALYGLSFNAFAILVYTEIKMQEKTLEKLGDNDPASKLLNKDAKYEPVINELLATYAKDNKMIKIYGPTAASQFNQDEELKDQLQAYAFNNDRIFVYPLIKKALKNPDHELHVLAKACIGHETGHIIHKDADKKKLAIGVIAGTTFCIAHKLVNLPIIKMKRYNFLKIIPALIIKNQADVLAFLAYKRKNERDADDHLIKYAKDPAVLHAFAHWCSQGADKYDKTLSMRDKLFNSHPSFTERAETFAKAARDLEEKLKK
ncbi:MAG: M48 family metalloprotease [Candidatus Babeliaceae bacterium]|jgi:Zn-dependent protease with chaperone function